jgi:hypothetical protein
MLSLRTIAVLGLLAAVPVQAAAGNGKRVEMANTHLRVILTQAGGQWSEAFEARSGRGWVRLLKAGHPLRRDPSIHSDGSELDPGYTVLKRLSNRNGAQEVELSSRMGGLVVRKRISLGPEERYAHVAVHVGVNGHVGLSRLLSSYTAFPRDADRCKGVPPEFMFTPVLRPEERDVIGDHAFRSPALMMQRGQQFIAVVPDPDLMNTPRPRMRTAADVQLGDDASPLIAYGFMPWAVRGHVLYRHTDSMSVSLTDTTLSFGYYVFCSASAPEREGYRDVVRFLWDRFGHAAFAGPGGPQHETFGSYIHKAWDEYLPTVAMAATYGGRPVTLLRQGRLAWSNRLPRQADNDCWFNVWFNALRTAYGMAFYGDRSERPELARQAEGVLNLALSAPQQGGIAPSIFYVDSTGAGHWVGDHAWGGIGQGENLPMFHNAWTGVWLLRWAGLRPDRWPEIQAYTGRLAQFLVRNQHTSGVIPSWYDPLTVQPVETFRDENAETAGAALFLSEYARKTGDEAARDAAEKAMQYVFREVVPDRKWFDFETFFSCSRKPLGYYDRYTGQHPQNTLSIHQAAEACLSLYALTGKKIYLDRGEVILDYLGLYQQVWSPRWLSCDLFGGFGVQNTDGEWSDSRQGYFAETYMRYFTATGKREYFERGVAALRAMFSLFESPSSPRTAENYAHGARDELAGVTGLHWGTGSSVVSAHLITAQYGDAYVDAKGAWGAGIDGCRVSRVTVRGDRIQCVLTDDVSTHRKLRLVIGGSALTEYRVTVNGRDLGIFDAAVLTKGIDVDI